MSTRLHGPLLCLGALAICGLGPSVPAAEETSAWDGTRGTAAVVTATFIGSPGNEWLSSGAFLTNNTILLGGVSLDPELELDGVKAEVLGKDAPPLPPVKAWRSLAKVDTGKIAVPALDSVRSAGLQDGDREDLSSQLQTDAEVARARKKVEDERRAMEAVPSHLRWSMDDTVEKATVYRKLAWSDLEATGFLAVFSPDLKKVLKLRRLPRGAGSISGVGVGSDGAIYISGGATERIRGATEDVSHLPEILPATAPKLPDSISPMIYVAKVSADLSKVLWVRTAPSEMYAPRLRVLNSGEIAIASPDVRWFTPSGEFRSGRKISRSRNPETVALNPVTGCCAKGGDFMNGTGREPYRTPYFFVFGRDGSLEMELFRWRGPFVGVDSLRLVADAQVERMAFDDKGNLIVFSRSHGGNCVQTRYPYDIDRYLPNGLGGMAQRSPGCVVKMSPDFKVIGAGVWNDPGFARCAGYGADGSVAWVGLTAHAPRVNALSDAADGIFAYVASPRLDAFRFGSAMPACGKGVVIQAVAEEWGIASGLLLGRPMLMFLSGAVEQEKSKTATYPAPLRNPVQPRFGGGLMDGYVALLDLSPAEQPVAPATAAASPAKTKTKEKGKTDQVSKPVRRGDLPLAGGEGQAFSVGGERYFNVQLTLREQPETGSWPRFYHGRADNGGSFTFSTNKPCRAAFTLRPWFMEQEDGRQDLRVLGDHLVNSMPPPPANGAGKAEAKRVATSNIFFEAKSMSAWRFAETRHERDDAIGIEYRPQCDVGGCLHFGGKLISVEKAVCSGSFTVPFARPWEKVEPGVLPNMAFLTITFPVTGSELGFGPPEAEKSILLRFTCTGYSDVRYPNMEKPPPPKVTAGGLDEVSE